MTRPPIVCVYNFYPVDESYVENLRFFLEYGAPEFEKVYVTFPSSSDVPAKGAENIVFIPVENKNNDYGSLSHVLRNQLRDWDGWVFVGNSSVRGPYLCGLDNSENWLDLYLKALGGFDGVSGDCLNAGRPYMPHSIEFKLRYGLLSSSKHVQTTNFLLSPLAVKHLRSIGFFEDRDQLSKRLLVRDYEIRLSTELRAAGLPVVEVRKGKNNRPVTLGGVLTGDPHTPLLRVGKTPGPANKFFIKTNRNLYSKEEILQFDEQQRHISQTG